MDSYIYFTKEFEKYHFYVKLEAGRERPKWIAKFKKLTKKYQENYRIEADVRRPEFIGDTYCFSFFCDDQHSKECTRLFTDLGLKYWEPSYHNILYSV